MKASSEKQNRRRSSEQSVPKTVTPPSSNSGCMSPVKLLNRSQPFANLKKICDAHLTGRYKVHVIDLVKTPQLAQGDQILAIPTLVRKLPVPIRKIIGDLSDLEKVLVGLNLTGDWNRELKRRSSSASQKRGAKRKKSRITEKPNYVLRLYVTGQTPRSLQSIENLQRLCEKHLAGRFLLEVIDIYQQPALAAEGQIIAAPTFIKAMPLPLRRLVGDFSDANRVVLGLDLKEA